MPGQCKGEWDPNIFFTRLLGGRGESLTTEFFALGLAHGTQHTGACYSAGIRVMFLLILFTVSWPGDRVAITVPFHGKEMY